MKDMMEYYLANPLQSEDNGIHISIPPKKYYPDDSCDHTVNLLDDKNIPIIYDGILPYIHVCITRTEEIDSYICVAFTSRNSWGLFLSGTFSQCSR